MSRRWATRGGVLLCVVLAEGWSGVGSPPPPMWAYDAHPDYWPVHFPFPWVLVSGHTRVSKLYKVSPTAAQLPYPLEWVWSTQCHKNSTLRQVIYQPTLSNTTRLGYREYELWDSDASTHRATFHCLGGTTPDKAFPAFSSADNCRANESGIDYITMFPSRSRLVVKPYVVRENLHSGKCVTGGTIASRAVELWEDSGSRKEGCQRLLGSTQSPGAVTACLEAPGAGLIHQHYVMGPINGSYVHGYSESSDALWLRNGEISFTYYLGLGTFPEPHAHDSDWWVEQCNRALSAKANMIYTGNYTLGSPSDAPLC